MAVLRNGLNLLNVPSSWEGVVVGTVLVSAVIVDRSPPPRPPAAQASGWRRHRARLALGALFAGLLVVAIVPPGRRAAPTRSTVAFVPKQIGSPFWVTMRAGAEAEARRLGVRLLTLAADRETDVERQHQIIENLIEQGVDALVVAPAGAKEVVPAVKKANRAGIPVLIVDSDIHRPTAAAAGAATLTYIGSDNVEGGRAGGRGGGPLARRAGRGGGAGGDARARQHRPAAPGVRRGAGPAPGAAPGRLPDRLGRAGPRASPWPRTSCRPTRSLRAIFGANDEMALGALEAVAAAGRGATVRVVGFDASPDAVTNIRGGRMAGSVAQFPSEMGRMGVLAAVELVAAGSSPPPVLHTKVELIDAGQRGQLRPGP